MITYSAVPIFLCVSMYVDNLIITRNDLGALQLFKAHLSTYFHMKDLSPLKYFLGIEEARSKQGIYFCQRKYAMDILSNVGLLGAKYLTFPVEQNH